MLGFLRVSAILVACAAAFPASAAPEKENLSLLTQVSLKSTPEEVVVTLVGSKAPDFTSFTMNDPFRVVVDWAGSRLSGVADEKKLDRGLIRKVSTKQYDSEAEKISRVTIELARETSYHVEADGKRVIVHFVPVPDPIPEPEPAPVAEPEKPKTVAEVVPEGPLTEPAVAVPAQLPPVVVAAAKPVEQPAPAKVAPAQPQPQPQPQPAVVAKVEPPKPEPVAVAKIEPAKVEPAKVEPAKKEPPVVAKAEPAKIEPPMMEPAVVAKAEPAKVEPPKKEPAVVAKAEPAKVEPAKIEPAKIEPKQEPAVVAKAEPAKPVKNDPPAAVKIEPPALPKIEPPALAKIEPPRTQPVKAEPAKNEVVAKNEPPSWEPARKEKMAPPTVAAAQKAQALATFPGIAAEKKPIQNDKAATTAPAVALASTPPARPQLEAQPPTQRFASNIPSTRDRVASATQWQPPTIPLPVEKREARKGPLVPTVRLASAQETPPLEPAAKLPADADEPVEEAARAPSQEPASKDAGEFDPGPRVMKYIGFQQMADVSRVFVRLDGKAKYKPMKEGGKFILELSNTSINVKNNERPLDTTYFNTPVQKVQAVRSGDNTLIEVKLKESVPYKVSRIGNTIAIDFQRAK